MATHLVRLRRAVISASGIRRTLTSISSTSPSPQLSPFPSQSPTAPPPLPSPPSSSYSPSSMLLLARSFRSTRTASLAARSSYNSNYDDGDKIDPDTILFEGCDFNHWLITMDFPKDPKPTPEEMVRTYEETCAKGLNISLEEAKKKIYACSTTTYQGFQALMTEAESEQFRGLPGVVFILPDSYIDPQNKEYGGDKYENGVITPRPPPVQYGRPGRRYSGQQRYDRLGGQAPNRQGNLQYDNWGPMQRGAPGNYPPQQNYGPSGQGDRRNPMPLNRDYASGGGDPYQTQRIDPQPQGNYNQQAQGDRWNSAPPGQNDYRRDNRSYGPTPGGSYGQGGAGGFHGQGTSGVYGQGGAGAFHGQGTSGSYGQGGASGFQGQGTSGGYGQEVNSGYGQGYMQHGEGQGFEPGTQRRMQEDTTSYNPVGQGGADQRRY